MNAPTDKDVAGLLDLLRDRGLDVKLMEERQAEREIERAELLQRLIAQEAADEAAGNKLNTLEAEAKRRLRDAEAVAAEARRELMEMGAKRSHIGVIANNLRASLRRLADPRIENELHTLRNMADKVRSAYAGRTLRTRVNLFNPDRTEESYSNSLEIGEALAAIKLASDQLEVLREQARPNDLAAFIKETIGPAQDRVRRLIDNH